MDAEAGSIALPPVHAAALLAQPAGLRIQSSPGMAATRAMSEANREILNRNGENRDDAAQV